MSPMRAVDLFAGGARGWDQHDAELGLRTLGYEWDGAAAATATAAKFDTWQTDVAQATPPEWSGSAGLKGGPPCTTFTNAGSGHGRRELDIVLSEATHVSEHGAIRYHRFTKPETGLVLEPLRWAVLAHRAGRPFRWVVLEQAREVLPVWRIVAEYLAHLGYNTTAGVLNAEEYGVPQTRRRAVLIASRDRIAHLPTPTHARFHAGEFADTHLPCASMYKALSISSPAPGAYLRSNYGTGGVAANRGRRMLWQPAPTITRKYNRNKWMLDGQALGAMSDRQAALLQTLPAGHPWQGSRTEVQLQIGNAIPALLAKAILQQVV